MSLQHPPDHFVSDQQRPPGLSAAHLIKGSGGPDIGVGVALPTGKAPPVLVAGPELPLAGEPRIDLRIDQAAEPAMVQLGELIDDLDGQAEAVADDARGRDRPADRTDEDPIDPMPPQHRRVPARLLHAGVGQRRVETPLPTPHQVPPALTMPREKHCFPRIHVLSLAEPRDSHNNRPCHA
jgi:hypothetical protein